MADRRVRLSVRRRIAGAIVSDPGVAGNARRLVRAGLLLVLGLVMALGAAVADAYLHRGIETSAEPPYVVQVSGRDLATNVDLRAFPDEQIQTIAATLRSSGFGYVRQIFSWADLEPQQDTYAWEEYDAIVRGLHDAGIGIVAVLLDAPQWSRPTGTAEQTVAPPADMADFAAFAGDFVRRYGSYIGYVQVWDHPNDPKMWGGRAAQPDQYLELLAPAFNAIRSADPRAQVILAEFADRDSAGLVGADITYLRAIYEAGGAPIFDVVAASVDGGAASPYDRRVHANQLSLSRAVIFREVLRDHDDSIKPIWLTHFGWDAVGAISREDQAEYLVAGIERIRAEWPWAGLVFQWTLLPDSSEPAAEDRALLNPDGTATLAYDAVVNLASQGIGSVAPTGFVPMDSAPVTYSGAWSDQHLAGRIFKTTSETGASTSIRFEGTGLIAYLRRSPQAGLIRATLDGEPLPDWNNENGASTIDLSFYQAEDVAVTLASNLEDGVHEVTLTLVEPGEVTMGGAVVSRDPPLRWPVVVALISALALSIFAAREFVTIAAERAGLMRARGESESSPPLPTLPDWRPSLRT
jgi:polysaccharide biosynthesis protein PslG